MFLKMNGMKHVKQSHTTLLQMSSGSRPCKRLSQGSVDTKLAHILLKYRPTPQSSLGISPAELRFARRLMSPLDSIRPSKGHQCQECQKSVHDNHAKSRDFDVNNLIYVRNYDSGDRWLKEKLLGSAMFSVLLNDGRNIREHAYQMRLRVVDSDGTTTFDSDSKFLFSDVIL